jgi:hypothetical protein
MEAVALMLTYTPRPSAKNCGKAGNYADEAAWIR